ncbi:MAG: 2-methylfumaryl-CoA isomerase [Chloroflexi bacterium]|nr:MAG: 2-methylfumaryl-CoA isomerase [Chloroflexota bacterium]
MGVGILDGLRIVEISAFVAAPLGGATLAAMGADVIRIDPPGGGVDIGRWPLHRGRSLYWAGLNQGKRSVTIDMRQPSGQEKVAKLIAAPGEGGGIFLTNLPVSGWNSYDELKKLRSDLIMVVITGNRDGTAAVDYTVNAALGFPFVTGPEDAEGPVNHVLPAWDAMTGFLASTAILAAERHRRLTGEGQLVELSLSDVGLAVAGHLGFVGEAVLEAEPRGRFGNHVFGTFGRDFVTRDGWRVMILALTPRQWRGLVEATGLSGEFRNLEARLGLYFNNEGDRWRGRQDICELIQAWVSVRTLASVAAAFDAHRVLWGPYQTFKELVEHDPRASLKNPLFATIDHPELGTYPTPGSPLRFAGADPVPPRRAPKLGEHTDEVLREFGLA